MTDQNALDPIVTQNNRSRKMVTVKIVRDILNNREMDHIVKQTYVQAAKLFRVTVLVMNVIHICDQVISIHAQNPCVIRTRDCS